MGFCAKGEGGPFVEGGTRIALDGELPLATSGGQLSAGRLHGYGHLYEACLQLRGQADERQVKDAKVAAVSAGAGPLASCLLLRSES
jgi:acetyl-CoA acetyltransferase